MSETCLNFKVVTKYKVVNAAADTRAQVCTYLVINILLLETSRREYLEKRISNFYKNCDLNNGK